MSSDAETNGVFNVAIATIFAREILEGGLIVGNYRMCILKGNNTPSEKKEQLRAVTMAALFASVVAICVILAVAIPLAIVSNEFDDTTAAIVEGVAKVVGAVAILQLSLKIPVWLGIYRKISILPWKKHLIGCCKGSQEQKEETEVVGVTIREIRFNVAWNIWREVAECGAFLIPFFLHGTVNAIPISAFVGTVISLILGGLIYFANHRLQNKTYLAIFMSGLMLQLSVGLFTLGCHEFEEVWGMTRVVWTIENEFWSDQSLPMTIFRPFGYTSQRTLLEICCFWTWVVLGLALHFIKWRNTQHATLVMEEEEKMAQSQVTIGREDSPPFSERERSEEENMVNDV